MVGLPQMMISSGNVPQFPLPGTFPMNSEFSPIFSAIFRSLDVRKI